MKFENVSLLITHYNRSGSLERLLGTLQEIECSFEDIIVSDDGSKPEHLSKLHEMQGIYNFRLVTTPVNKGLGNNINKGQAAVTTPYTVYIQEDFIPSATFPAHFKDALDIMQKEPEIDMIRFYGFFKYPYLKPFKKGFSTMIFSPWPWYRGYKKFYYYSDHPHLRRTSFPEKFGKYAEGVKGDVTEYRMMMSFLRKKGKALLFEDFHSIFSHDNSDEPSTMVRSDWRRSNNFVIAAVRETYLSLKFIKHNFDLLFMRL